ncbi:hypothetical protein ACFWMU_27130 [Streptomyces sp. NPDC058357]|uniref:hypothetical protein n=1 Tax=unclassified Streptomyces TaxID=2593676 RepID=UPI003660149D
MAWFQAHHGLPATGQVCDAPAGALRHASDAELLRTFRTADDLGPKELLTLIPPKGYPA